MSQGVPIQRIGLQCHTDDSPIFRDVFDAAALYDIFDTYAEFGLPLVLSEVSVPSRFAGENLPSQGLLGENFREKEAYREIDRLINREWRTDVTGVTDPNGQVSFHGYNSTYERQPADPVYAEKVAQSIPCGFYGTPEDCTGAVRLLCSDAGRYITGQSLYVDGGKSVQ